MKIKKVTLHNIRVHDHLEFEPKEIGITAISGDNGKGKSSILDGIMFCLFGSKINGLKQSTLIKKGCNLKKDGCYVTVTFLANDGNTYTITRELVNDKGQTQGYLYKDDTLLVGPSITDVNKEVLKILGVNEKIFLNSVFVKQKEIDRIVNESGKEREKLIEDLVGISLLTDCVKDVATDIKDLKKEISLYNMDYEKIEQVKSDLEQTKVQISNLSVEKDNLTNTIRQLELEKSQKESEHTQLEEQVKQLYDLQSKMSVYNDNLKKYQNFNQQTPDLTPIITRCNELEKTKTVLEEEINNSPLTFHDEMELNSLFQKIIPQEDYDKATTSIDKINKNIELKKNTENEIIQLNTLLNIKTKDKNNLSQNITGGVCQVCKSKINNPQDIINDLTTEINNLSAQILAKKQIVLSLATVEEEKTHANNVISTYTKQQELKPKFDLLCNLQTKKKLLADVSKEYNSTIQQKVNAERQLTDIAKRDELLNTVSSLQQQIDSLSPILSLFAEKTQALKSFEQLYNDKIQQQREITNKLTLYQNEILKLKENTLKDLLEKENKFKALGENLKVKELELSYLSNYKEKLTTYSRPILENLASEFLTEFTTSKFVKVNILDDYSLEVVDKYDNVYNVKQISGGELSLVALSLRLAIAEYLQNNSLSDNNLLIFDEVLVSLAQARQNTVMEALTDYTDNKQIILVAHSNIVANLADKIISL